MVLGFYLPVENPQTGAFLTLYPTERLGSNNGGEGMILYS
jgi:hypothetical protein